MTIRSGLSQPSGAKPTDIFVDREDEVQRVVVAVAAPQGTTHPCAIHYRGVPGIGHTALARQLRRSLAGEAPDVAVALCTGRRLLDEVGILDAVRASFLNWSDRRNGPNMRFGRYDTGRALLDHLRLGTPRPTAQVFGADCLGVSLDAVTYGFGRHVLGNAWRTIREWWPSVRRLTHRDFEVELDRLDELGEEGIAEELPDRLVADIAEGLRMRRSRAVRAVLLLDGYDQLFGGLVGASAAWSERLAGLVADLTARLAAAGVLTVLFGAGGPDWRQLASCNADCEKHDLRGLPSDAAIECLCQRQLDRTAAERIVHRLEAHADNAVVGLHPMLLDWCVEMARAELTGSAPTGPSASFELRLDRPVAQQLRQRLFRDIPDSWAGWLETLGIAPWFDRHSALAVAQSASGGMDFDAAWNWLLASPFVRPCAGEAGSVAASDETRPPTTQQSGGHSADLAGSERWTVYHLLRGALQGDARPEAVRNRLEVLQAHHGARQQSSTDEHAHVVWRLDLAMGREAAISSLERRVQEACLDARTAEAEQLVSWLLGIEPEGQPAGQVAEMAAVAGRVLRLLSGRYNSDNQFVRALQAAQKSYQFAEVAGDKLTMARCLQMRVGTESDQNRDLGNWELYDEAVSLLEGLPVRQLEMYVSKAQLALHLVSCPS